MTPEAMLEEPAAKIGRHAPQPGESLFFVTKENTIRRNQETLTFLMKVASGFPFDSSIKKELASLSAQAKKDPSVLANMKTTVGVEQIA